MNALLGARLNLRALLRTYLALLNLTLLYLTRGLCNPRRSRVGG